jgi:hypothetical protein
VALATVRSTPPETFTIFVDTLFAGIGSDSLPPTPTATVCVPSSPGRAFTIMVTVTVAPDAIGPMEQNSLLSQVPCVDAGLGPGVPVAKFLNRWIVVLGTCVGKNVTPVAGFGPRFLMTAVKVMGVPVGVTATGSGVWFRVTERSVNPPVGGLPILVTNACVEFGTGVGGGVSGFNVGKSAEFVEPVTYAFPCESNAIEPREEESVGPSKVEKSNEVPAGLTSEMKLLMKQFDNDTQGGVARIGLDVGKSSAAVKPVIQASPFESTAMEPGSSRKVPIEEPPDSVDSEETEPPRKVE